MSLKLCRDSESAQRLHTIRALYEPYANALSDYLKMPLPVWAAEKHEKDQWSLLTKLRSEAEAAAGGGRQRSGRGDSVFLHDNPRDH